MAPLIHHYTYCKIMQVKQMKSLQNMHPHNMHESIVVREIGAFCRGAVVLWSALLIWDMLIICYEATHWHNINKKPQQIVY